EAMMSAAHFGLDNLTVFLDSNELQIDGNVCNVMNIDPIDKKAEAFGWNVLQVNGHSVSEISDAIQKAKACKGRPTYIICRTVKGKGVSFMENQAGWHGSAPNQEQYERAMLDLTGGVC
ncbi:MAG: transketolase, partial [Bacillota bacterium]